MALSVDRGIFPNWSLLEIYWTSVGAGTECVGRERDPLATLQERSRYTAAGYQPATDANALLNR